MSTLVVDTLTGKSTATTLTIGSTPVVSASANSLTIRGEGSAQTSVQQGLIKSWMNLDGDLSTPAVLDSFNTSSIQDVSAGRYTQIVTSAFSNANYSTTIGPDACDGGSTDMHSAVYNSGRATTTTNVHVVGLTTNGGAFADLEHICAMSAGDLA